jgi:hypothetical protein
MLGAVSFTLQLRRYMQACAYSCVHSSTARHYLELCLLCCILRSVTVSETQRGPTQLLDAIQVTCCKIF